MITTLEQEFLCAGIRFHKYDDDGNILVLYLYISIELNSITQYIQTASSSSSTLLLAVFTNLCATQHASYPKGMKFVHVILAYHIECLNPRPLHVNIRPL